MIKTEIPDTFMCKLENSFLRYTTYSYITLTQIPLKNKRVIHKFVYRKAF